MTGKTLFFDEAGYTGADLLNQDQPYFVVASALFSQEEIAQLKQDINYDAYGNEFHFVNMRGKFRQKTLLDFFRHPLMNEEHIRWAYADKRYCVYAQMVDVLIETFMYYRLGEDLYRQHGALLMANCLHSFCVHHADQSLVLQFERHFVEMVREHGQQEIALFYATSRQLYDSPTTVKGLKDLLTLILASQDVIQEALVASDPFYLDTTLTLFVQLLQEWYEKTTVKYDVVFDDSKPIATRKSLIERLRDMADRQVVGYGSKKHVYPLPIGNLTLGDSATSFGIQIADMAASAYAFLLNNTSPKWDQLRKEMRSLPFFQMECFPLAPSSYDYLMQTQQEDFSKDVNPLDFLARVI